jgi:GNAT superfamily N-acetyltransferase
VFDAAIATRAIGDPPSAVAAAIAWFDARSRRGNFFLRCDADREVAVEVQRAGFAPMIEEPVLVLEDAKSASVGVGPPSGIAIATVGDRDSLADYASTGNDPLSPPIRRAIAETAYAMPGAELLIGRIAGAPVATSMCVLTARVIGVFNVNVLPAFRRRGLGSAMTMAAVAAGARRGGRLAWLGSTPMSDGLYRRLGFREIYRYVSYVRSAWPVDAGPTSR